MASNDGRSLKLPCVRRDELATPFGIRGTNGIAALWTYPEDGTRAKKPAGLSRQSSELRVGDFAEICRGRGTAGYRGIGVGYVEHISLAFDSEEMALRELWNGEFANVDLSSFRSRGTDRISFPAGIPFHRLKSLEDNWPYKGKTNYAFPQDHGYQFRGYHLDAQRRPTIARATSRLSRARARGLPQHPAPHAHRR